MRQYPRCLYKGKSKLITVHDEHEEFEAGVDGWESHWNPEINEKRKGTDKEVLQKFEIIDETKPVGEEETEEVEEELVDPVTEEVVEVVKVKRKRRSKAEIEADNK